MPVTVVLTTYDTRRPKSSTTYAEGEGFYVKEGHLFVTRLQRGSDQHIGGHAPGSWISASLDPIPTFQNHPVS